MDWKLTRVRQGPATMGALRLDQQTYHTLEPAAVNPVHVGHPCIPAGRYQVKLEHSPRFGRQLPELQQVPGRTDILIHRGNTAKDTHGCILPGLTATEWAVASSALAEEQIIAAIRQAEDRDEEVWITVEEQYA